MTWSPGHHEDGTCSCHPSSVQSVCQTLDEMDFERGIWNAALNGDLEGVKRHILRHGKPNEPDPFGYTALKVAKGEHVTPGHCCRRKYVPVAKYPKFDDVITRMLQWSGKAETDFASQGKSGCIVDILVPDLSSHEAQLGKHYASRNGHYAICHFLLEHGASCNVRTHGGASPLHRAAFCGHAAIAKLLLGHGADPAATDDDGKTCLHKAAENGHQELCDLILEHHPQLRHMQDNSQRRAGDLVPAKNEGLQRKLLDL